MKSKTDHCGSISTVISSILLLCVSSNRLFENSQRQFYKELDREERCNHDQPVAEESKQFWGNIWSQSADQKKDVKCLQDLQSEVNVIKQEKIDITTRSLKKILGRMPN